MTKLRRWYGWFQDNWDAVRSSYWLFPVLMALVSGVAALALIELDRRFWIGGTDEIPWIGRVSASSARVVLSTIAGSMMTVTGVVFSITVVALTLASSQFGPRLLRTFFRDRGSQVALGTFLSTFFFSLLVLRAVENPERVPVVATAVAVIFAVVSLFVLIYFVHHVASSLQASSVIAAVAREIDEQLPVLFPSRIGEGAKQPIDVDVNEVRRRLAEEGIVIRSRRDGYVRIVNEAALLELSRRHDLCVELLIRPGGFVTAESPVLRILAAESLEERDMDALRECVLLGDVRTPVQDLGYLTGQLSEMAVRALSPGINDPSTAIACIDRLGSVVERLSGLDMPSAYRLDESGELRVIADPPSYAELVSNCFGAVRRYGAGDLEVALTLLDKLAIAANACQSRPRRRILREQAGEVLAHFVRADRGASANDRRQLRLAFERVGNDGARHA